MLCALPGPEHHPVSLECLCALSQNLGLWGMQTSAQNTQEPQQSALYPRAPVQKVLLTVIAARICCVFYHVPDTDMGSFNFIATLQGRYYYHSHFQEETEAQRSNAQGLRGIQFWGQNLNPSRLAQRPHTYYSVPQSKCLLKNKFVSEEDCHSPIW